MDVLADRYELGRTLGSGGMARVVEAHDRLLDRAVAVKLLRDDIAADSSVRERFLREARTAAKFTHPNAVTVFDTGQDGRQPWIVMELVRGEDLAQRLATSGALEPDEAVRITSDILAALDAAHRDGMVHRDVKPGNIMLLDDGGVKLTDFGIAKSLSNVTTSMTATGQIIGTAKYLSPEQIDGHPATPASDVYATGVVLYEMLAGTPPFVGKTAIAVALAHTRDPVPNLRKVAPHVPTAMVSVVERALEKDPARRYADAGEMRRALSGKTPPAAATTPTEPLNRPATRVLPSTDRRGTPSSIPLMVLLLAVVAIIAALLLANATNDTGTRDAPVAPATDAPENEAPAENATQPAEEEATQAPEEEQPATEIPPTAPPPLPEPTDLPTLISLLTLAPDRFGTRQEEFRKELEKVLTQDGDKQSSTASRLSEKAVDWANNGELDPTLTALALEILEPYAAAAEEGEGNGAGKGNGDGDD